MNANDNAAKLLNLLALLTIIAADCCDQEDAEDTADFWYRGAPGGRVHLADGRVVTRF